MKLKTLQNPIDIDKNTWCYLEGKKVTIVHEVRDIDGTYHRIIEIKLPIKIIEKWFQ